jgi:hypothetical protein
LPGRQLTDVSSDQPDKEQAVTTKVVNDESSNALFLADVIVDIVDIRVIRTIDVNGGGAQLTSDVRQLDVYNRTIVASEQSINTTQLDNKSTSIVTQDGINLASH